MASDKKPSIYSDRSTIGSSDELDEYGVWVKSEPQDFSSTGGATASSLPDIIDESDEIFDEDSLVSGLADLDLPDLDIPDDSMEIDDEAPRSASFDNFGTETLESLDDTSLDNATFDEFSIPDDSADSQDTFLSDDETDTAIESSFKPEGFSEVPMEDFLDDASEELPSEELPSEELPSEELPPSAPRAPASTAAGADLSTQLLMKIAEELSSIRNELSTLKEEFAGFKPASSAEEKADAQHGGFFTEEEDEKISLTGDELDNILNTADFTEEAGEDATEELEGEFTFPEVGDEQPSPFPVTDEDDFSVPDINAVIESEDALEAASFETADSLESISFEDEDKLNVDNFTGSEETFETDSIFEPEETIETEDVFEPEEIPEEITEVDSVFEPVVETTEVKDTVEMLSDQDDIIGFDDEKKVSKELEQLREKGVEPMTPAPEDTSYLDEDPMMVDLEDGPSLESILSDEEQSSSFNTEDDTFEIELEEELPDEPAFAGQTLEEQSLESQSFEAQNTEEQNFDDVSIDLSDAVIDEPDIGGEINENPLVEPSLDTLDELQDNFTLNMDEETDPFDNDTIPSLENEVCDIKTSLISAEDDSLAKVIPEGFEAENGITQMPLDDGMDLEEIEEFSDFVPLDDDEPVKEQASPVAYVSAKAEQTSSNDDAELPSGIKAELKTILSYMDQLLESLPDEKIEEFARSEYFDTYKKLFKELGLA